MLDEQIILKIGKKSGNDADYDNTGGDAAEGSGNTAGKFSAAVPDKYGYVDRYNSRKSLADGIIIHNLFFCNPFIILNTFFSQYREHGIAAAKGNASHFKKGYKDRN